ncbi:unnamed protein product [Lactuca virosa]|uniref:Aminotransferase-like plant mobile domain-containing protein n=1 Tax=Lactuca virosa TaxID=75947 RepID=A0AAU9MCI5_9ASTR|nr:unnamed protein product [Lactuca virosa]
MQLDFGETEYILICGLKVGPYVDLLHDEKDGALKRAIPTAVYKLADNIDDWNRFAWGTYFWTYTSGLMRGMFEKIEKFRLFKQANPESKKRLPPRQQSLVPDSPPVVVSPPRRKKYKSETSSTESATNAFSSQQPVVERTYMSSDTSTRSVKKKKKKKKTSIKELVKRLLGIVVDLTSKVDRILQKQDEPDTWFGEDEEMVNEGEEEPFYHADVVHSDAIHTKIEENHQNKEKKQWRVLKKQTKTL